MINWNIIINTTILDILPYANDSPNKVKIKIMSNMIAITTCCKKVLEREAPLLTRSPFSLSTWII